MSLSKVNGLYSFDQLKSIDNDGLLRLSVCGGLGRCCPPTPPPPPPPNIYTSYAYDRTRLEGEISVFRYQLMTSVLFQIYFYSTASTTIIIIHQRSLPTMKIFHYLLIGALVLQLVIPDAEAGWFSRTFKKIGDGLKNWLTPFLFYNIATDSLSHPTPY